MSSAPRRLLNASLVAALFVAAAPLAAAPPSTQAAEEEDRRPTVAVLYFDYDGPSADLGVLRKGLAQMLVSDLMAVEQARVVERSRLQEILAELELGASKKVDADTAAKIGRLLGARYLVLGGFFELSGALRVDARVVDVETGRILQSVGVTGKPGDFLGVEQELAQRLQTIVAGALPPLPKRDETGKSPDAPPKVERPKPPKKLETATAIRYSKALDAKDRGDKEAAKKGLEAVLEVQPDFELASIDLAGLMQ